MGSSGVSYIGVVLLIQNVGVTQANTPDFDEFICLILWLAYDEETEMRSTRFQSVKIRDSIGGMYI